MNGAFEVRVACEQDLTALAAFFLKAYGPQTVFQDHGFLRWYFGPVNGAGEIESLIAVNSEKEVIAHYGGLQFELLLNGRRVSAVWGANAFTLQECRGCGIGQRLVEVMMERHDVFGVIGFTPKTAAFYDNVGFNVFQNRRYDRFARALDEGAWEVAGMIGADLRHVRTLLPLHTDASVSLSSEVISIDANSCGEFIWDMPLTAEATTWRDLARLRYRFFDNSYIAYRCLAVVEGQRVLAAIFSRQEPLLPTDRRVERIVDIFGTADQMPMLIDAVANRAKKEGISFVDAGTFGGIYDQSFETAGFTALRGDEAALLPQVTSPIEARPNLEFIGLFSRRFADEIAAVQQVHFTRADSDRDRIARLSQIQDTAIP